MYSEYWKMEVPDDLPEISGKGIAPFAIRSLVINTVHDSAIDVDVLAQEIEEIIKFAEIGFSFSNAKHWRGDMYYNEKDAPDVLCMCYLGAAWIGEEMSQTYPDHEDIPETLDESIWPSADTYDAHSWLNYYGDCINRMESEPEDDWLGDYNDFAAIIVNLNDGTDLSPENIGKVLHHIPVAVNYWRDHPTEFIKVFGNLRGD